jgi:hypothetical protein
MIAVLQRRACIREELSKASFRSGTGAELIVSPLM